MQYPSPQRRLVAPLQVEGPIPPRLRNSPYLSQSSVPRSMQPSSIQPWHDLAEPPLTAEESALLFASGQHPNRRSSSTDYNNPNNTNANPRSSNLMSPQHYVPGMGAYPSSSSSPPFSAPSHSHPSSLGSLPRVFTDSDEEDRDIDHPRRSTRGQSVPAMIPYQHTRRP